MILWSQECKRACGEKEYWKNGEKRHCIVKERMATGLLLGGERLSAFVVC
jgi:hypothetical protein